MTYFDDLQPCDYFGKAEARLLAIGWLDGDHTFTKGRVTRATFETLAQLVADAWQPFAIAGRHACEFCLFTGGPAEIRVAGASIPIGASNVFVPFGSGVYVAPSLILHYIDAHGYAPPETFLAGVETCPPMRSMAYIKALREQGVHRIGAKSE